MSEINGMDMDIGMRNVTTTISKAETRKDKKRKALLKKASSTAAKFRKDEEAAEKAGKKFDKIKEMRKRRKALLSKG